MKNVLTIISLCFIVSPYCKVPQKNVPLVKKVKVDLLVDKVWIQDDSIFINYDNSNVIGYLKPDFWKDATTYRRDSLYNVKENSFFFDDIYYEKRYIIHSYDFSLVNQELLLNKIEIEYPYNDILTNSVKTFRDSIYVNDLYKNINSDSIIYNYRTEKKD